MTFIVIFFSGCSCYADLKRAYIRIFNSVTGEEYGRYELTNIVEKVKTFFFVRITINDDGLDFKIISKPSKYDSASSIYDSYKTMNKNKNNTKSKINNRSNIDSQQTHTSNMIVDKPKRSILDKIKSFFTE